MRVTGGEPTLLVRNAAQATTSDGAAQTAQHSGHPAEAIDDLAIPDQSAVANTSRPILEERLRRSFSGPQAASATLAPLSDPIRGPKERR